VNASLTENEKEKQHHESLLNKCLISITDIQISLNPEPASQIKSFEANVCTFDSKLPRTSFNVNLYILILIGRRVPKFGQEVDLIENFSFLIKNGDFFIDS
jgi:hypothetical protein